MNSPAKLRNIYTEPDVGDLNPGKLIKAFLENEYPSEGNFLSKMDDDFRMDGKLSEITYQSSIGSLLRRLVCSAHYIHRAYHDFGDARIRSEMRNYLKNYTRFADNKIASLINWLNACVQNSKDDFSSQDKKTVRRQLVQFEWGCYICGRELDLANVPEQQHLAITADHFWPRLLGGESEIGNLRFACSDCNNKYKKDFLNYADYHYEQINFVVTNFDHYIHHSRVRGYEAAVFSKSDFCCVVCNQPAYKIGELFIGRNDLSDSFHFFNLSAYCADHKPE
ncbi:MAG TPA: HNH endonuclease [Candidatus Babeliaceae bacterium]|nr:HNH endonuclease [Candidatus Babeliaceae bacterium]